MKEPERTLLIADLGPDGALGGLGANTHLRYKMNSRSRTR